MSVPQFYETGYGRTYYEHQLPTIMKHLSNIAAELKRGNDLKEQELKANEVVVNENTSRTKWE